MNPSERLLVGIDWATETHQVAVEDEAGSVLAERPVRHSAEALAELCAWLLSFGKPVECVHVAIEVPHGAVVETLLERGFSVFSINPRQLDRFRDRFSMSGAKDDRRDARVLADSLRTDAHCFRRLDIDCDRVLVLREWSRMSDELGEEHTRLANRLREQLQRYYPQFLVAVGDPSSEWALDLWAKLPAPSSVGLRSREAIARVLKRHRVRRTTAGEVFDVLRQPPLRVASGTVQAACEHIALLADRLRVVSSQVRQCRRRLKTLVDELAGDETSPNRSCEQRDVTILLSVPGVGSIVGATLLAEASRPLRDRDYQALRALSGVAPVTLRSGKGRPKVEMRRGCNLRLRNALYHWARVATQHDPLSKSRYAALRARGHSHGRALRSVADRLLSVLMAMLRSQTLYRRAAA